MKIAAQRWFAVDGLACLGALWAIWRGRFSAVNDMWLFLTFAVCVYWLLGRWSWYTYLRTRETLAANPGPLARVEAYFLRSLVGLVVAIVIGITALIS
jgi:hypothetical protein